MKRSSTACVPTTPEQWRCSTCGRTKPLDAFYRRTKAPLGRQYRCKTCMTRLRRVPPPLHTLDPSVREAQRRARRLRDRARRLAQRLARAELMLALCLEDYGLERAALLGPRRSGTLYEAQVVTTRLLRSVSLLHPAALAEMLDCSPQDVQARLVQGKRWQHSQNGDIRIVDRMQRLRARFRARKDDLVIVTKPYHEYTPAQRQPGTHAPFWTEP